MKTFLGQQRFKKLLAVCFIVTCIPLFGHGQNVCASLFDKGNSRSSSLSFSAFTRLSESDFISQLQSLLTPEPSPELLFKAQAQAEQDVRQLEEYLGGHPIPESQRAQSLFQALRVRSSDNYSAVVNGPEAARLSTGWAFDAYVKQEIPEQAFYGKILKVPLIDFWYQHALAGSPLAKMEIDAEKIYSFYIGRARREWNGYQDTKSTARLLQRNANHLTVIERYALENKISIPVFEGMINQAQQKRRPIFELGRVSNMTENKAVMLTHRLLMSYYVFRKQPESLIVLATSSMKLVEYYQKWGFTSIETMSQGPGQEFYLMAVDAKHFIEMTLKDFQMSTP